MGSHHHTEAVSPMFLQHHESLAGAAHWKDNLRLKRLGQMLHCLWNRSLKVEFLLIETQICGQPSPQQALKAAQEVPSPGPAPSRDAFPQNAASEFQAADPIDSLSERASILR